MITSKEKWTGIAGTVGVHALVLLFLVLYYITPTLSRSSLELEGVPVMFGNVPDAGGNDEPLGRGETASPNEEKIASAQHNTTQVNTAEASKQTSSQVPEKTMPATALEKTQPVKATGQSVHSQDNEQTVAMAAAKKAAAEKARQEAAATEKARREAAEAQRQAQEQAQKSEAIKNQTSGLFGNGTGSGSRGETSGKGTQGVPTGNASHGKTSGVGGLGTYDLGGRGVGGGGLVQPNYNVDDYGKVVIDIIVDPKGNVVEASIGKGTNTPNATLRSEALKAARRTKFTAVNTAGNQKGTITYKFNLR